jgi:hypothetical protein
MLLTKQAARHNFSASLLEFQGHAPDEGGNICRFIARRGTVGPIQTAPMSHADPYSSGRK